MSPIAAKAADTPAVRLLSAAGSPSATGWNTYNDAAGHTEGAAAWTQLPPEIKALARSLGAERADPAIAGYLPTEEFIRNVHNYVRNNIATEFRFGLGKGARGALIDQSGSPFDQAELMVKLLRARIGVTAVFQTGSVTLSAQQFGRWSGLAYEISAGGQAFRVNALAACKLLGDGGTPATCAADGSGDLISVTLGHVWVIANGKAYDASFKQHSLRPGLDLASVLQCGTAAAATCGADLLQLGTQTSTAPAVSGLETVKTISGGAVAERLDIYAQRLEAAIKAGDRFATLSDVIGGGEVDITYQPALTTSLPYVVSQRPGWTGDIPDPYRTKFTLTCGAVSQTLYADEIAGRRIYWGAGGLYADSRQLQAASCDPGITYSADGALNLSTAAVVAIDHPYAANGGAYADETVQLAFMGYGVPVFVLSVGDSTPSTQSHMADLQVADPAPKGLGYGAPILGTQILAQHTLADRVNAGVSGVSLTQHHTVGVISDGGFSSPYPQSWMTMHTGLSVVSRRSDAAAAGAAFETAALMRSLLEGSVSRQQQDSQFSLSGVAELVGSNQHGATFIRVAGPGEMQTLLASGQLSGYSAARQQRLQAIANEGYEVILPQSGANPCSDVTGAYCPGGFGLLASKSGARAYLLHEMLKGGATVAKLDPAKDVIASAKRGDYSLKQKAFDRIDLATGALQLKPPPDVVAGVGAFPFSLPFQREYSSASAVVEEANAYSPICPTGCDSAPKHTYTGPDRDVVPRIGGGWTFNLGIGATLGNDALRAFGQESALDASGMIAGVYALNKLLATTTLPARVTSAVVGDWVGERLVYNSAVVTIGSTRQTFHRLPSGAFNPQVGGRSRLSQVNHRIPMRVDPTYVYNYGLIQLAYTGEDGSVLNFDGANGQAVAPPWLKPTTWVFPTGVKVQFNYTAVQIAASGIQPSEVQYILSNVTNSLGRSLTFESQLVNGLAGKAFFGARVTAVTTDGGQTARYALSDCPPLPPTPSGIPGLPAQLACNTLTVTLPGADQPQLKYSYAAGADSPDPGAVLRSNYRLRRWYMPSDQATPAGSVDYDELWRVKTATDALGRRDTYFASGLAANEPFKLGAMVDPTGASTVETYDRSNSRLSSSDPLGRLTTYAYDTAKRPVRTTFPELNAEELTYDVRGNVLRSCQISKTRPQQACDTGQGDLAVTTIYPDVGAFDCNVIACNKPQSEVDARGATTYFGWTAQGNLAFVERPADRNQQTPRTDYGYSPYTANGATFYLLTTRTDRIGAGNSVVSSYAYSPANRFVLATSTVDPSGLALTTSYGFDTRGNIRSIDGPRAGAQDTVNYDWDAQRRLLLSAEPDPDGAGPDGRTATKFGYSIDGELLLLERGVSAAGLSASDFTALERSAYVYDRVGNKIREVTYDGVSATPAAVTDISYDVDDRVECSAVRMMIAQAGAPGGACEQRGSTANPDRITRNTWDLAGQLKQIDMAYATPQAIAYSRFDYTANGKRAYLADARGNRTSFRYDGFDRLIRQVYPTPALPSQAGLIGQSDESIFEAYGYDTAGNRTSFRRRNGQTFTYEYDALNRQVVKHVPGDGTRDVYLKYDLLDRVTEARFASAAGVGTFLTYDKAGRQRTETTFGRTVTSDYDAAGARTAVILPDTSSFTYDYDPAGRLSAVRETGQTTGLGALARFQYDPLGRRKRIDRGNGGYAVVQFDGAGRLTSLEQRGGASFQPLLQTMAFNPASQAVSLTQANADYVWKGRPTLRPTVTYDGLNRDAALMALPNGYDANGNVTDDGVRRFYYDVENRLVRVEPSPGSTGPTMDIGYDPMGRIASTLLAGSTPTVTDFVYDGDRLLAEYGSAGQLLRRYVHGNGVDEPLVRYEGAARRWLHADRQGSIVAESTDAGVVSTYTYGPWGEPNDWGALRFRYTGQIALFEAQLYHYKARVYDPMLGRFLQTDPIGQQDDSNLYAYVRGDPINRGDPSGLAGCGTSSGDGREKLTINECAQWQEKQATALKDVAATRAGIAAYRSDPKSAAGSSFAKAATDALGSGALSKGNLAKLDGALAKLEAFYKDPGTASGGKYDVYRANGWSNGGTIINGQVAFGSGYFSSRGAYSRLSTIHEPMHLPGFAIGRDMSAKFPNGVYGRVAGDAYWDRWYAREHPIGAQSNIDNWACLISRQCR